MKNQQSCQDNEEIYERLMNCIKSSGPDESQQITRQFLKLSTIVEKVDFVIDLLSKYDISPEYIKDHKDNNKSSELRNKGNKLFSLKKDEEALEMYTYSISFAENKSENLGLAFANRSAVLFRFELFEECLRDIEKAFENNYPDALKPKIIERKEKALSLKAKQKKIQYYEPMPSIDANDRNPLIECASNCVEIKNDSKQGRFVVATRDIEIGEIIAVESPTFSILTDVKWCHCHHCLKLCYNPLPCNSCTKALFCSPSCKNNSISYHKYECPILATIESLDYNSCRFMPLRIGISMRDRYKNFKAEIEQSGSVYKSGRYKEIHDLVTNEMNRLPKDLFERATCTTFFYIILRDHTDFFEGGEDFKGIFAELIFRHLQTMACNFHDISELCLNSNRIYDSIHIGVGAYNFMSLFNHSCSPNVCRNNFGTYMSISAIETIKKGDQLFDNYGFHFAVHPKSKRQAALKKQYAFDCDCQACKNNWGTLNELKSIDEHRILINSLMKHHGELSNANLQVAIKILPTVKEAMKKLEKSIPCYEFCLVQEILKQCDGIFGNVRRSLVQL
ncbi:SET and MYND domain-containing protein 4-like isoform X1 [Harmonia axyridis]|uniref:SET and MYND domain-containing protein 4-like isoform X1 n=1 Tax=Harmonia axyridis TaxID=115357 RepID=UPI001E278910|nr:SET and MYND domain-containing protein 4-like isoform X1 [Harmonia axyridis]XP_045474387.1 SET and MYND domain-containing protein 4-like isoform X1 [Harmonia axyridis]